MFGEDAQGSARDVLARHGRVHIADVLPEATARALRAACERCDWRWVFKTGGGVRELDAASMAALTPSQREGLRSSLYESARKEFQFLFETHRISDLIEAGDAVEAPFLDLYRSLNGAAGLERLRNLTGDPQIRYVDMQATRYSAGCFLNTHDDLEPGKDRAFAYVLNLTSRWRTDWGGVLEFPDGDGHVAEGYAPRWNALNVFRVPQPHAVGFVAPYADEPRYSITGWMRRSPP